MNQINFRLIKRKLGLSLIKKRGRPSSDKAVFIRKLASWIKDENKKIFSKEQVKNSYLNITKGQHKYVSSFRLRAELKKEKLEGIQIIESQEETQKQPCFGKELSKGE